MALWKSCSPISSVELGVIWIPVAIVYFLLALVASGHALINRPTPRSALVWLGTIWFFPLVGMFLYFVFGMDRIRRRALIKGLTKVELHRLFPQIPAFQAVLREYACPESEVMADVHKVAGRLTRRPLLQNNSATLLINGEQAYPAMLQAIDQATSSINLMTYIFDEDPVGQDFIDHLAEASARGVAVRVLYDAAGSFKTSKAFFSAARERGFPIEPFFPLNPLARRAQLNLRNHRKLLVVDGRIGFLGGMNISQRHLVSDIHNPNRCMDLHLHIEGPVVQQIQEVFAEDWYYAVGEEILNPRYFPELGPAGEALARIVTGGPDEEFGHIHLLLFSAIGAARQSIQLVSPYFIPGTPLSTALRSAAMRGIETEVFLPQATDHPIIRRATYANLLPLVSAGVKVWEHPPPFVHAKAYLFDGNLALMGSPNFDPRGFRLNYELIIEISSTPMLDQLKGWIDLRRSVSRPVTVPKLKYRPLTSRLVDHFWNLLSPAL
ncbi:MAG: cardiolipin synthase [Bradymonadales bacterium]|nr:cardiolipin synthase [Bradymonadales bacterium]